MSYEDINRRFSREPLSAEQHNRIDQVTMRVEELAHQFDVRLPDGREKSLALTKLEEAHNWAAEAIARQPIREQPIDGR